MMAKLQQRGLASGTLLSVLALVAQFGFGALSPQAEAVLALSRLSAICHGNPATPRPPSPPYHHGIDCTLCPLCTSCFAPAVPLPGPPQTPLPHAGAISLAVVLPPASTPPPPAPSSIQPRGPPSLLA